MQGARPGRLPPLAGGARTPGAAAVSLRDRAESDAYVQRHSISALMRELTESVILHRPEHLMNGLLAEIGAQNLFAEHLLRLVKPRMQIR